MRLLSWVVLVGLLASIQAKSLLTFNLNPPTAVVKKNFWMVPDGFEKKSTKTGDFDLCKVILKYQDLMDQFKVQSCQEWIQTYLGNLKSQELKKEEEIKRMEKLEKLKEMEAERFRRIVNAPVNRDFILRNL